MDHWAPVVRYNHAGTGQMTNDVNTVITTLGPFNPGSNAADCAAHGSAGAVHQNAYGELTISALTGATSKAGFWLRFADSSNYYAAYMTPTGAGIDSIVAGATTALFTDTPALGTLPGVFRAEVNGDVISIYWRGVFIGSATDTALVAPGFASIYLRSTTSTVNVQATRFETGPLTASYPQGVDVQQAGPTLRHARLR